MVGWSRIARPGAFALQLTSLLKPSATKLANNGLQMSIRQMSEHRSFEIVPSRFQWHKFKDTLHFYVMLGAIPALAIVFYTNVFIGPATLKPIPEGYVPKHWEYHKHPISRFLARYVYPSPQQEYEKILHVIYEESDKAKVRELERRVMAKINERHDYQAFYYRPVMGKYHRIYREEAKYLESLRGD